MTAQGHSHRAMVRAVVSGARFYGFVSGSFAFHFVCVAFRNVIQNKQYFVNEKDGENAATKCNGST